MGKSCSCLSVPKENQNVSDNNTNMDKNIFQISDVEYNELAIKSNYNPEMTSLLTNGYIRLTMLSFGIKLTNIAQYKAIIALCCEYYDNDMPLIRKRCIFTSIMHLNLCIDEIPLNILDESIFFFKMNKMELFSLISSDEITEKTKNDKIKQKQSTNNSHNPLLLSLSSSTTFQPLLIKYLQRKRKEGLLLLFENNKSWNDISLLLENISDTFYISKNNKRNYNKLKTDIKFWGEEYRKSRFIVPLQDIICELNENNLKFYPSMEIIKQSNPTLIPMKTFDFNQYKLQNGCHGMTWINNNKFNNYNGINSINLNRYINDNDDIISDTECIHFTYCVGEEEFIQSDFENEITINSKEIIQSHELYGFTDSSDYDDD